MNKFINEKYYIESRKERYNAYYKLTNLPIYEVIREVNCNLDYQYYTHNIKANTSLNSCILVNKYYKLDPDYIPNNLVYINSKYSIRGCIKKEVNEAFIELCENAINSKMHIINSSPYRSYKRQQYIYNELYKIKKEKADLTSAKPGYSEHQTGYAIDVRTDNIDIEDFIHTKEFNWMKDNAYKYGFILRYPKGKERLTGYNYEPWHYRYVGKDIAEFIKENDITFDEYYAYYIEK